jgi:hypothetical protein
MGIFLAMVGLALRMVVSGGYLIKIVLISATIHGMVGGGGFEVGNDAARIYGPWHDSAGGMNTKSELPDLPATPSPLQSELPVMKDISGATGWWWESTLREAKCYY